MDTDTDTDRDEKPDAAKRQKLRQKTESVVIKIMYRDHIHSDSRRHPDRYACVHSKNQKARNKPKDTPTGACVKSCSLLTCVNMSHLCQRGLLTSGLG